MINRSTIMGRAHGATRLKMSAVGFLALILAACSTTEAPGPIEPSGAQGRVRFVNVITDAVRGRVNVSLEGLAFGVDLIYATSAPASLPAPSTAPYAAVLAGNRAFVLKRTADTTAVVATLNFTVAAGEDKTVYAVGGVGGSAVTALVTTDDNTLPTSAQTRFRFVQLSPTAGAVDIFVTAAGADLSVATPTVANLGYQGASTYLAGAPGTFQIRIVPAGTAPANRAASATVLASLALAGGAVRTIVVADNNVGGAPLRAFLLNDR